MPRYNNPYRQNRMSLNTADFQPAVFTPIEFTPVEQDYSILERSLARQEARQKEAAEKESAIDVALGKIETELHNDPETQQWFRDYKTKVKQDINDAAQVGDYANAVNIATRLAGSISSDSALLGRVKANQEYQAKADETHKRVLAGQISEDTENWWKANNPFTYEDRFDANGNVIGGTSYADMSVPVADINIAELTQNAFKAITPNATQYQETKADGTGFSNQRQWVTRQQIVDNLNEILDLTPGARKSMYQRYQVEQYNYEQLLNDENADPARIKQQKDILKKNGSTISFEEFCVRMIEQSAISQNLAYDHRANVVDNQPSKKGKGSGSDETDSDNVGTEIVASGEQFEDESYTGDSQQVANTSGKNAGNRRN